MRQLYHLLLLILLTGVPVSLYAQKNESADKTSRRTVSLWGHVRDSFTKVGIPGVKITVMLEDSTVVDTGRVFRTGNNSLKADYAYRFKIPAEPCRLIIRAQHPDYEDTYVNYHIRYIARNSFFDAPWHYMKRRSSVTTAYEGASLREVTVKGTRVKIAYRGDTIVYDASAFKLPDGSMLDALVRQLPGAELKDDGTITVNGRKIDYLTLNGKDFFKGNNKVMLDNLPYFTVQNLKVYNRTTDKSRYLGRDMEQKEYVMDVNLKKEYRTGYLGNAELGGATSDRYMGRLFLSRFTDHTKVTAFANVNNINETRNPESNGDWRPSDAPEGKTTNRSAGLNIQTDGKDAMYKNSLNIYGQWNQYAKYNTFRQTQFLDSGNSYSLQDNRQDTRNRQLSVSNYFNLQLPVWIESATSFTLGDTDDAMTSRSATLNRSVDQYDDTSQGLDSVFAAMPPFDISQSLLNSTYNRSLFHGTNLQFYQSLLLNKKLPWGDNLEIALNGSYGKRENKTWKDYNLSYPLANKPDDDRDIFENSPTRTYRYEGRLEYYFNFRNKMTLRLYTVYNQERSRATYDYYRLDQLVGWASGQRLLGDIPSTADSLLAVRSLLNSKYENRLTRNSKNGFNLLYSRQTDSTYTYMQFHLPLYIRNEQLHFQRSQTDTCASRTKLFADGEINMTLAWKKWKRYVNIYVNHRTLLPDMSHLVAFDYTNPLAISLNNPNLKTGHRWNVEGRYQHRLNNDRISFSIAPIFSYTTNPILTGFSFNRQTGAYIYQPQNGDKDWTAQLGLGTSGAIDKKQFWTFNFYTQLSYNVSQVMQLPTGGQMAQLVDRHDINSWSRGNLFFRKDNFTTGISGSINIRKNHYDNAAGTSYRTLESDLTYAVNYTIPVLEFYVGTTFSWHHYANSLGQVPAQDNYVWNATLSRSLLKGKKLTVKLTAFDLLNSVSNYNYFVNTSSMTFKTTERIGRYVMLSLAYKLSIMPKKK